MPEKKPCRDWRLERVRKRKLGLPGGGTGCLGFIGDDNPASDVGIITDHYKDPEKKQHGGGNSNIFWKFHPENWGANIFSELKPATCLLLFFVVFCFFWVGDSYNAHLS